MASVIPKKIDLTPKRHHGYSVFLFIMGTLFPPIAVAARFGIGKDFWLNLVLTICGYIPGHAHNFYIQNIRNNKNHARTPKWVQRYGLVDTSEIKRKERKSQWANRYNDRLPQSTLEGQPYEEGQDAGGSSSVDLSAENGRPPRQPNGDLWRPEDESYYNPDSKAAAGSGGRWHYPANFEDVEPIDTGKRGKKKKEKKDRWERTQDAYSIASEGESRKKKKKKRKGTDTSSIATRDSGDGEAFPEDASGGLYGERRTTMDDTPTRPGPAAKDKTTDEALFSHEF